MLRGGMSEADWEALALDELDDLGELAWPTLPGTAIASGTGERPTGSPRSCAATRTRN